MTRIRGVRRAGLRLRAYALLSRSLFPRSYLGKVLLAAFVGTHIPLLALVLYVLLVAGLPVTGPILTKVPGSTEASVELTSSISGERST